MIKKEEKYYYLQEKNTKVIGLIKDEKDGTVIKKIPAVR